MSTTNSIKYFINRFLPTWVVEQYGSAGPNSPTIVNFLTYFLEYLNTTDTNDDGSIKTMGPLAVIDQLLSSADIDLCAQDFLIHFKATYAENFPYIGKLGGNSVQTISTEIHKLLKHIRDFYVSKGTEDSLRFFFRAVFGKEITLYFPTNDILRVSDGKWVVPYYFAVENLDGSPANNEFIVDTLLDSFVVGQTSKATAFVLSYSEELYSKAAETDGLGYYLSMTQLVGAFQESEQVNFYHYENNQLLGSYRIKTRGYENIPNNLPAQTGYMGQWLNRQIYQIGNIVFVPVSQCLDSSKGDKYYIALAGSTGLSIPEWQATQLYRVASVVSHTGEVYRVADNRTSYISTVNPYADLSNWTIIGTSNANDSANATWVSGTTYNNYAVVKVQSSVDSVWRLFELALERSKFVSSTTPDADPSNWVRVEAGSYNASFIVAWVGTTTYYAASEIVFAGDTYRANEFVANYKALISPLIDSGVSGFWNLSGTTTDDTLWPEWSLANVYNPGETVLVETTTAGTYGIYELKPLMPITFHMGLDPSFDTFRWSEIVSIIPGEISAINKVFGIGDAVQKEFALSYNGQLIESVLTAKNLFKATEFLNGTADAAAVNNITEDVSTGWGTNLPQTGLIVAAPTSGSSYIIQTVAVEAGQKYSWSAYIRMSDGNPVGTTGSTVGAGSSFNFNIDAVRSVPSLYKVQLIQNGVYRISYTFTAVNTATIDFELEKASTNDTRAFTTSGWQLEFGDKTTDYQEVIASGVPVIYQIAAGVQTQLAEGTDFIVEAGSPPNTAQIAALINFIVAPGNKTEVLWSGNGETAQGIPNFFFDQTDHLTAYWAELPSTVTPENVGVGDDFPGSWIGHDGWLDSEKKIQDSYFYQAFSYQITVNLDRQSFLKPLIDNVHPTGFQVFNVVQNVNNQDPTGMVGVTFGTPNVYMNQVIYFELNEWRSTVWYVNGDVVMFNGVMYSSSATGPYNSILDPASDTGNWTNVSNTTTERGRIFKPTLGYKLLNLIGNDSRITVWMLETDVTGFELIERASAAVSIVDSYVFSDFRRNAGNQNQLLVQNGLVMFPHSIVDASNVY